MPFVAHRHRDEFVRHQGQANCSREGGESHGLGQGSQITAQRSRVVLHRCQIAWDNRRDQGRDFLKRDIGKVPRHAVKAERSLP